jgi:DNA-binding beta-propeller fold protein YncE
MKRICFLFSLLAYFFVPDPCRAQIPDVNSLPKLVATIALPEVSGRIDHLAFDPEHQTIYVAALGNNSVEVVDLKNMKVLHSIRNLDEPQGISYIPESKTLVLANGGNGECTFFDAGTFQKLKAVKLAGDADNVRYDSVRKRIYVGFGSGGIAIIDATNYNLIADVKLSGHPESFQLDKSANKIYVNVPDEKQIEVIDLDKNIVSDRWKMSEASSNFPMSLDEASHHLFIGCRHPAKLVVIDTQTGEMISSMAIDGDVDDIFYNKTNQQIYLSCGAGYVDIFKQADDNSYTSVGKIPSRSGARTSLLLTDLNLLIVASPSGFNSKAALLVYSLK